MGGVGGAGGAVVVGWWGGGVCGWGGGWWGVGGVGGVVGVGDDVAPRCRSRGFRWLGLVEIMGLPVVGCTGTALARSQKRCVLKKMPSPPLTPSGAPASAWRPSSTRCTSSLRPRGHASH